MSNDTENKLKPCPFCGGDAKKTPRFLMGYNGDGVICSKCSIETPKHITDQRAFDLWNNRVGRNHAIQKPQTTEEWYNSLSEVEKIDATNCVRDMRGKWNGMNVVFYQGLKIDKRKFDWIKRNITGSKL